MKFVVEGSKVGDIINLSLNDGFRFNPKLNSPIDVEEIVLYDSEMINIYIYNRFIRKYKKLLALVISIIQDDDSTDDAYKLALDELAKQRHIINAKYSRFLKKQEENKYLKKIEYLEMQLKNKYMLTRLMMDGRGHTR